MTKILIIEDEPDLSNEMEDILKNEGHKVYTANSGINGLKMAKEKNPNLILCDIMMPGISGFEVLERWKKEHSDTLIPFIFITGLSERCNYRKGMETGADDYLTKPFTPKELVRAIQSKLDKYSTIENRIKSAVEQIEQNLYRELNFLKAEMEDNKNAKVEAAKQNISLQKQLDEKEIELMEEVIRLVDTRNTLYSLKKTISEELLKRDIPYRERDLLLKLKNRLNNKSIATNNWAIFQLKVNQVYPDFIKKLNEMQPDLTQYELVFVSAIKTGMNTNEIAQLFNISNDSVRKSRYRIKKKFGLRKEDNFLNFLHSIIS